VNERPRELAWLERSADGRAWLERLASLVAQCAEEWSLELGPPFADAYLSLAMPARLPDGTDAVLKVAYPHAEAEHEAAALARWDGNGAVRLLRHDTERWALLLERCTPGTPLSGAGQEEGLGVLADLLQRLWVPAGAPFRPLAEEAEGWAESMPGNWKRMGRPFERTLLDTAVEALRDLSRSQGEQVLLHQDLHGDNVLRAEREPWLVIDPKPLVGEREFGLAPIVRSFEFGHSQRDVLRRLDRLSDELQLDRERARLWAIGQTIAWCFDTKSLERHLQTARWLVDGG